MNKIEDSTLEILSNNNTTSYNRLLASIGVGGENGLSLVKYLLIKFGTNILNNREDYWTYPLHYSIIMREEEIAIFLIKSGADVNKLDSFCCSPLNYAVSKYNYSKIVNVTRENAEMKKLVLTLVLKGADVGHRNPTTKLFPYYEAINNEYYYSYKQIDNRMNTIIKDKDKYPDEFKQLDDWIKEDTVNSKNLKKVIDAILVKNENKAIKIIDEFPHIIHGIDTFGQTVLHYAVRYNLKQLIKKLIIYGIDFTKKNKNGIGIFDICDSLGNDKEDMIRYIVELIEVKDRLSMNKMDKNIQDIPLGENIKSSLSEQYNESSYFLDDDIEEVSNNKSKNKNLKKKQKLKDIKIKQRELLEMRNEDIDIDITLNLIKRNNQHKTSIDDSFFIFQGELQDTFWNEESTIDYY